MGARMKRLIGWWLAVLLLGGSAAYATGAADVNAQKLALVRSIYVPVFDQIRFEDVKAQYAEARKKKGLPPGEMSRAEFERVKQVIYESYAEALTVEDLQLQKQVAGTAVGKRMLSNIPRSLSGLAALPLSRDQFTDVEWQVFQNMVQANREQFIAMTQRMNAFPAVFAKHAREMQQAAAR